MTRPATRLREGLERIQVGWKKLNAAVQDEDESGVDVPSDTFDELDTAEADIGVSGDEDTVDRLLEALNDEYQRGREDAFCEAAAAARQAAENTTRSDVAVGGIVQKVVEGFIAWCEVRARESSR